MKRIIHFLLAVSTVGLLAACSQVVSSDDSQEWSLVPSQDSTTNMTIYEAELLDNYILLDLYYMYGHKRNELDENYKVYLNKGTKQNQGNKGYCTAEFYDVCYMYSQVKDNYTRYYDPYVASEVLKRTNYSDIVVGVGAEVETVEDSDTQFLRISQVYPHSPSEKAGLLEGDIIYTIDGVSIRTEKNFNAMCTGNKGDILKFIVGRDADTIVAAVELEEYYTPTVRLHYEDSIPVIEIQEFTPQMNEVMSSSSAYKMISMLRAVIDEGTGKRLRSKYGFTADICGKTGTTNDNSDGWFMGFTPRLVAGCWVGGDERTIHFNSTANGQGAAAALPIWALFMKKVYADKSLGYSQDEKFDIPEDFDLCESELDGLSDSAPVATKPVEEREEGTGSFDEMFQ